MLFRSAKYLAEMICDRIAACKIYLKDKYSDDKPIEYFESKTDKEGMNPQTCEKLRYFLKMLKEEGEKQTFKSLKRYVKDNKKATR